MSVRIENVTAVEEPRREAVYAVLRAHNQQANPVFWAARELPENDAAPVSVLALDEHGDVVGGLFGTTQFAWLKVDVMAVAEASRGTGIGRGLLNSAEAVAIQRGCTRAYVDTMDYQAPGFYQRMGYAITGKLEDWDSMGHSKYFLVKPLSPTPGQAT